jgi:hypothetical protein
MTLEALKDLLDRPRVGATEDGARSAGPAEEDW